VASNNGALSFFDEHPQMEQAQATAMKNFTIGLPLRIGISPLYV
jgi:hypothetical protein